MSDNPPGYDDIWDTLVESTTAASKSNTFKDDPRAQSELMYAIAQYYPIVTSDKQQAIRAKLVKIMPRLQAVSKQGAQETLEAIVDLARFPNGYEEVSRALKVRPDSYRKFVADPDEDIYPRTGWLGDYLEWARNSEVPLGYHFWSAVGIIGAACGYKFFIDRSSYYLRLNFYTVMVGEKATGKSAAKDAAVDVLRKANFLIEPDPRVESRYQIRLLPEDTNQETLVSRLQYRTETKPSPVEGADPISVIVDSTGFMVLDELSTFLGKDNWALAKRIPFLTTMYGREYYNYETKSGGSIKLMNIALSMLACSAPEWMKDSITPLMFGGGFMDRTMFVYRGNVTRSYPTPAPLDPISAVRLAYFIKHLAERDDPVEMLPTAEALEWYDDWYDQQPKTSDLTGMSTKRRANNIWKLAGVLSISDGAAPWIRASHVQAAARYLDYEEAQFERFMNEVQRAPEDDQFKYILRTLRRHGGDMTKSALFNILRQRKGLAPPNVRAIPFMTSLQQMGLIDIDKDPKGRGVRYVLTERGKVDGL